MIQQPHEEFLLAELDRLLAPATFDGTEGHALLKELVATVCDASGDPARIRSALINAERRQHAIIADTVPREAVNDAVCRIVENWR